VGQFEAIGIHRGDGVCPFQGLDGAGSVAVFFQQQSFFIPCFEVEGIGLQHVVIDADGFFHFARLLIELAEHFGKG
jgi:hypothetical protein